MISLFTDLLNLSVIESQKNMAFDDIDLQELYSNVGQSIITNYPEKKINLSSDLKCDSVKGVPRLIEQVLANLIDNSCKYSGDEISIKVSSFQKDHKSFIVVSDNGPGIPKEHLQRIFERFYRVDSSRESSRGTGLGLSIVKHIIAKHGGKIWAESDEKNGTDFIIELPIT
jgi:signal transduction histidine kinase